MMSQIAEENAKQQANPEEPQPEAEAETQAHTEDSQPQSDNAQTRQMSRPLITRQKRQAIPCLPNVTV